ncbi:MAG: Smr/MutS family protein [Clostridiales bacterium]|nr:Smr/MutS family protein [Clostridiales bacterium]
MQQAKSVREYAILEYYKALDMLAERAVSDLAKDACMALTPSSEEKAITKSRIETDDAVSVCFRKGTPPFSNIPDLREALTYAEKGGTLTLRQLLQISGALGSAKRIKDFLSSDVPEGAFAVRRPASALTPMPEFERRIADSIVSDTELADGASSELRRLRRSIERQNEKIRSSLTNFITGRTFDGVLMDKVVTLRNGRFVVPVKQEQATRFPGIIHDRSKGGATVFVEPQIVVDMNNKLRELELEEQAEVERIIAAFSVEAGGHAEQLRENQGLLVHLDFIFAKANLALDMKACPAELSDRGVVDIKKGRNPLIAKDKVVPVSIRFGDSDRLLVVTGPNTGGKTVTLKTVGLFILMAQSGLHVPASSATLPVVRRVFADIGDEQSIEQSLSTFSSHMKNIVEIVSEAEADSIVLLDELGAGTDPTEGAALAIAILEELRSRGCLVMATTHYTELKKYAISTAGVGNASMEFDVATLSPTYRLCMGSPGRSNAFDIASKLGLDKGIVARSRELLDAEAIYFDDVMEQIESDRMDAAKHLAEIRHVEEEAREALMAAEERLGRIEKEREDIISKAREEAEQIVADASDEADAVRDELKAIIRDARTRGVADGTGNVPGRADHAGQGAENADGSQHVPSGPLDAGDALRRTDESRKRLRKRSASINKKKAESTKKGSFVPVGPSGDALAPGDIVALPDTDSVGEVMTAPDDKGRVVVRIGTVKLTLASSELVKKQETSIEVKKRGEHRYAKIVMSKMDQIRPTIDIHGKNLDEAEMMVEKYLDDAILARMHEVVLNHGRGSGILREGIRKMLKKNKHVARFRNGDFDEGGDGVTVVTLSDK